MNNLQLASSAPCAAATKKCSSKTRVANITYMQPHTQTPHRDLGLLAERYGPGVGTLFLHVRLRALGVCRWALFAALDHTAVNSTAVYC